MTYIKKEDFNKTKFYCLFCNEQLIWKGGDRGYKFCNSVCCGKYKKNKFQKINVTKFNTGQLKKRATIYHFLIDRDGNRCSVCNITGEDWNGHPLRLWVDHIDGNPSNDAPTNFRLICPNCESQTPTSRGGNRGNGRSSKGMKPYS